MKLRPYQVKLKDSIKNAFTKGDHAVILCSPTGSGKTVTFADIAKETVANGAIVMIAVDRSELLDQARNKLIDYGLNPSIIKSGKTMRKGANCYVATVQTLKRRVFPTINLLIIDEAHKQIFDPVVLIYKEAGVFVIGATATPVRKGKMTQLAKVYDAIVEEVTIAELIQLGFLVPAITYSVKMDTSKIKIVGGEYEAKSMGDAFDRRELYAGTVEKYQHFTPGTKAICFNANVKNSLEMTKYFNDAGISAVHVDGTTPQQQRASIFSAFKKGMFQVLCNVDIATTGFDEWTIETVIVNRVTLSLSLWLQMGGRGSRITPEELQGVEGWLQKTHFNLLDMGGNVYKLGFWEQERSWSLEHKISDKLGIAPVKECPEDDYDEKDQRGCGAMVPAPAPKCSFCGFIFPKEERKLIEGEFIQVENYQLLPAELIGVAWGSMTLEQLESVRVAKGYKQGWIIKQIAMNMNLRLVDYARLKEYKNPEAWVHQICKVYRLEEKYWYYYQHDATGAVWKQPEPYKGTETSGEEINEITVDNYLAALAALGKEDGDEFIYNL